MATRAVRKRAGARSKRSATARIAERRETPEQARHRRERAVAESFRAHVALAPEVGTGDALFGAHRNLLDGVPTSLQIGSTMTLSRTSAYASLIASGVLPALRPRTDEPSLSYLKRCCDALAKQHPRNAFTLTLAPYHAAESDDSNAALELRDPVTAVFYPSDHNLINARPFERAVAKIDRRISSAVMRDLATASCFSLNAFTAASAFDAAEVMYFDGDLRMWWDEIKYAAAHDLGIKETNITGLQVRQYLRTNEIRTPGRLKREIGAHHAPRTGRRKKRALPVRPMPRKLAVLVDPIITLIASLKRVSLALKRVLREDDYSVLQSFSSFAHPR